MSIIGPLQRAQLSRARYRAGKKAATTLKSFAPAARRARTTGVPILANSLPKSGTHLLERMLDELPGVSHGGAPTQTGWTSISESQLAFLARLSPGRYALAHLPPHDELRAVLQARDFRTLFMIRDPRDIAVSYLRYVGQDEILHPLYRHFSSLKSTDDRLEAYIHGIPGVLSPARETLEVFAEWLSMDNVLTVRYEDLIDPVLGPATLRAIGGHVGARIPDGRDSDMHAAAIRRKNLTFRTGGSGRWKETFSTVSMDLWQKECGDVVAKYGYR